MTPALRGQGRGGNRRVIGVVMLGIHGSVSKKREKEKGKREKNHYFI